ncbi:hypothetical protein CLOP_g15145 [Closterium sp. NIES-67]|nr:hypothetical protein CLOP_g15145 [Closterium sp. NIES-67]
MDAPSALLPADWSELTNIIIMLAWAASIGSLQAMALPNPHAVDAAAAVAHHTLQAAQKRRVEQEGSGKRGGEESDESEDEEEDDEDGADSLLHPDDACLAMEGALVLSECLGRRREIATVLFSSAFVSKFIVDTCLHCPETEIRYKFAELFLHISMEKWPPLPSSAHPAPPPATPASAPLPAAPAPAEREPGGNLPLSTPPTRPFSSIHSCIFHSLSSARTAADKQPRHNRPYWELLCKVVQGVYLRDEEEAVRKLLDEEIQWLQNVTWGMDGREELLEGHLLLLRMLVEVLDCRPLVACSPPHGHGLLHLLITRCLFPEWPVVVPSQAAVQQQQQQQQPPPQQHQHQQQQHQQQQPPAQFSAPTTFGVLSSDPHDAAVFRPLCSSSPSRNSAFALLLTLCAKTPEALRELASLLLPLHFGSVEHELPSWEYLPSCAPRPRVGYSGLKNAGATCYMNSVFQQLFMQPQVRRTLLAFPETPESDRPLSVIYQVQAIFGYLLAGCADYFVPEGFWGAFRDYDGQPVNLREHQDAFEFFNRVYDSLDESIKARQHSPTLTSIFGGAFAQQIICRGCPHRSEREEPFAAVSVDVKGKRGLQESLEAFVQGDLLEADNAYFCGQCSKKVDALKRVCIKALPPTLIIHLKRFDFDYETMQRLKLKDRFAFPLTLNMRPFTREGLAQQERERGEGKAKAQGREEGKGGGRGSGGAKAGEGDESGVASKMEERGVGPEERERGGAGSSREGGEKGGGGGEGRGDEYYEYSLVGVVVHSGTAFAGHYYSYIKERCGDAPLDHSRPSQCVRSKQRWLCFDDKRVEAYDLRELEKDCFGGKYSAEVYDNLVKTSSPQEFDRPNSAYMLFYERNTTSGAAADAATATGISTTMPASTAATATTASTTAVADTAIPLDAASDPSSLSAAEAAAAPPPLLPLARAGPCPSTATNTAPEGERKRLLEPSAAPPLLPSAAPPLPPSAPEEGPCTAVVPYRIPASIHHCVWQDNLRFQQESRLLDQTYFRFLLQLARVNLDVFQMCHDRGKMAALSDVRAGGVKASPQRSEALRVERAAEETAEALLALLLPFLFRVYLRAHASLRTDDPLWTDVLSRMLEANSSACRLFNARLAGNRRWLSHFLLKCPINAISMSVADLLATSCQAATCFLNARPLAPVAAAAAGANAGAAGMGAASAGGSGGEVGAAGAGGGPVVSGEAAGGAAGGAVEDALNVDALVDSLVSLLRDAGSPSCHVDNLCSIFVEYARIGPPQRLSLIRKQLPATCFAYLDRVGIPAAAKLHLSPLHSLLSILIRSCHPHAPSSRALAPAAAPRSGGEDGGDEEGEGEGDEGEGGSRVHGKGGSRGKGEGRAQGREERGKRKGGQGGGVRRRGHAGSSAGAAGASGAAGAAGEAEEEEEEDAGLQNPAFFGRPVAVLPPRVAQLACDPEYVNLLVSSSLDNQDAISLLEYISFAEESASIIVLREAMSSLQRAAVTSSRRILSLLLHLLKLPDTLQEARQESVVNGCQFFRPGVFDLLLAKHVSALKRYALLKFLLATATFSAISRRLIALRRADLSAVLQWLQEETANAPGHELSNEELPSGTLRRTATVDSTIAMGLSLISRPHEPNA